MSGLLGCLEDVWTWYPWNMLKQVQMRGLDRTAFTPLTDGRVEVVNQHPALRPRQAAVGCISSLSQRPCGNQAHPDGRQPHWPPRVAIPSLFHSPVFHSCSLGLLLDTGFAFKGTQAQAEGEKECFTHSGQGRDKI